MCLCNSDTKYGAFCEQDVTAINETLIDCNGNGKFNSENTITGCSCRDENNNATKFHGWHCEISNMDLCDPNSQERISHSMMVTIVGCWWHNQDIDAPTSKTYHQHPSTTSISKPHCCEYLKKPIYDFGPDVVGYSGLCKKCYEIDYYEGCETCDQDKTSGRFLFVYNVFSTS